MVRILLAALLGCGCLVYSQPSNTNLSNLSGYDTEPSLAVNPADPNNLIAGWMRLRLDRKIWIATRASFDGGQTWSAIKFMPHASPDYGSADVSIVFHRSGVAYLSYVDFRVSPDTAGAVFVSSSTDGGLSWESPRKVIDLVDRPDLPGDRPWIAIDNSGGPHDGAIYVVVMSAYFYSGQHHIYLRRSDDGGLNWSPIARVDDDSLYAVGISKASYGVPSVGANSRLAIAYFAYDPKINLFRGRILVATSTDGGETFQRWLVNDDVSPIDRTYSRLPYYTLSCDPARDGNMIVSWVDKGYGDLDVLLSRSTDGGQTWSFPPRRLNDDALGNGIAQDLVWSHFSLWGNLAIAWRDRRHGAPQADSPFDIYAVVSTDGGNSFSRNFRLSEVSSPFSSLPCCNSFLGLAAGDEYIDADWGDYRTDDWEVFHARVPISAIVAVEDAPGEKPATFGLEQNYPNPFNPETIIKYQLPRASEVEISIFNLQGQNVVTLVFEHQAAGVYRYRWNAIWLASGVYVCRLQAGRFVQMRKMLLIR